MSAVTPIDTPSQPEDMAISHCYMTVTSFNNEGSCEVGISVISDWLGLVNSQLAMYSHVRCTPHNTPLVLVMKK